MDSVEIKNAVQGGSPACTVDREPPSGGESEAAEKPQKRGSTSIYKIRVKGRSMAERSFAEIENVAVGVESWSDAQKSGEMKKEKNVEIRYVSFV